MSLMCVGTVGLHESHSLTGKLLGDRAGILGLRSWATGKPRYSQGRSGCLHPQGLQNPCTCPLGSSLTEQGSSPCNLT